MESQQFILYVSTRDSKIYHPSNSVAEFDIELPHSLHLDGTWYCALTEIQFKTKTLNWHEANILVDICEDSYVCDTNLPILRRIVSEGRKKVALQFSVPYYIKVSRNYISRIKFLIKDEHLKAVSFITEHLTCVLHLKRVA